MLTLFGDAPSCDEVRQACVRMVAMAAVLEKHQSVTLYNTPQLATRLIHLYIPCNWLIDSSRPLIFAACK